ncbi:MAG TPA: cisplatin damage response ATP-dependent DNA ligase [Candidatus Methylacidiphilales bacterium]|nr:cisplatin damage response ATP-dependent DNA ligase [Candidatus Methylacidiphilales bacterium]
MKDFAKLLDRLYFTHSNLAKAVLLKDYFARTPDPDRGYALAAIAGTLDFAFFKRALVRDLIVSRTDPVLFEMSYDYVGETSETIAHLWPVSPDAVKLDRLPTLSELVETFGRLSKEELKEYLATLLDNSTVAERWALLKFGMGNPRVGVTTRFAKNVLADYGTVEVHEIEEVWHSLSAPYVELFQWLEKKADKPKPGQSLTYMPVMLSHPLEEKDLQDFDYSLYSAEWKYDGIRVQLISNSNGAALFSRTGDQITQSFPDLLAKARFNAVLDGELLVKTTAGIGSFNDLQQRLNRKRLDRKMMQQYPAYMIVYDALFLDGEDMRPLPFLERRQKLSQWWSRQDPAIDFMELSELLELRDRDHMNELRLKANRTDIPYIEGLMLKRKDSAYVTGRPKGLWFKWKRDPLVVDAVLMYAQRGTGKRSSFYSDYTFGLWLNGELLPVGKAYSGFTDEELKQIDSWIRRNSTHSFGPVREVKPELVFELAFDSVAKSTRHKSGFAMRFPRISRIRWDKPAADADRMEILENMVQGEDETEETPEQQPLQQEFLW